MRRPIPAPSDPAAPAGLGRWDSSSAHRRGGRHDPSNPTTPHSFNCRRRQFHRGEIQVQWRHNSRSDAMLTTVATTVGTADSSCADSFCRQLSTGDKRHESDVPTVVVMMASSRDRRGHFAALRWQSEDEARLAGLFIAGERLRDGAAEVRGRACEACSATCAMPREYRDLSTRLPVGIPQNPRGPVVGTV